MSQMFIPMSKPTQFFDNELRAHLPSLGVRFNINITSFDHKTFDSSWFKHTNIHQPIKISRSVKTRQAEYFAGRYLAAVKLKTLNKEDHQLTSYPDRSPAWPSETIGSISHAEGVLAIVVETSLQNNKENIGIDIQPKISRVVAEEIGSIVATPEEVDVALKQGWSLEDAIALLFSTKESIYKALMVFSETTLDFKSVRLCAIDKASMQFELSSEVTLKQGGLHSLCCDYQYLESHQVYLTACYCFLE
ncbi:4'-phosphopantetheinyl transferase superfamily protein [Vibrio sp. L3-7]|uniref:4'-phosphopantetheinyl transferase family protein n=1 Tax=Vibrio sp. L3-7 TaxID=2912253 RepID=UPI001193A005|nr:4'-phosphopantetheinyl transferase superfamily protein [Vibrio sp. L3-7]MCF7505115.1 4'-phosphopantetheinyl transferase superfamily protein [Vibrio sp. L3-7]TVU79295.1 4'-phosphopantetheinyl transferase superfamily protein [Vibrio tasmaniensis]